MISVSIWIPLVTLLVGSGILVAVIKLIYNMGRQSERVLANQEIQISKIDGINRRLDTLNGQVAKNILIIHNNSERIARIEGKINE